MRKLTRRWLVGVLAGAVLLFGAVAAAVFVQADPTSAEEATLTEVVGHIDDGDVVAATVSEAERSVSVTLDDERVLEAVYVGAYGETLTGKLLDAGVDATVEELPGPSLMGALAPIIGPLLIIAILVLFLSRTGAFGTGTKNKQAVVPDTRFDDVAGCAEAVAEMKELVEFLKDGTRFTAVGARPPKGALLVGPPGTGKTLLARAVAGEAGVPFFEASGSDFVEKFVGMGASRVRSLFKKANEAGAAIIFIDEIDAAGRTRGSSTGDGSTAEHEGTLTALLTEIDGFESTNVIVIGATNRSDVIDPALLRRLERVISVPLPDRGGRTDILAVHAKGKPFADDVDWVKVGQQAFGMSGADLEKVVNEAAMEAARRGSVTITEDDVYAALSTIEVGRARTSAVITDRDRQITAWHEAGHAMVAAIAEHVEDPTYVTIIPRGASGGHTRPGGNDHSFISRPEALDTLAMMMGGRAAEIMLLGEDGYTQGASSDLRAATDLATRMVTQYGMGDRLVQVHPDALRVGGEVSVRVEQEVDVLLTRALLRATEMLTTHQAAVRTVVAELIEHETLTGRQMQAILTGSAGVTGLVAVPAAA